MAHWRVGSKKMSFAFGFDEFNARADLPNVRQYGGYNWNESELEQVSEYYQGLRQSELEEEAQQLLVGDLEGCELGSSDVICHTSDNGGTCSERCGNSNGGTWRFCRSQNCTRNCSASVWVYCWLSFPPHSNGLPAVNETGQHSLDSK